MEDLQCWQCFHKGEVDLGWKIASNGINHLGAYCRSCGCWIKWVPQIDRETLEPTEWLLEAPKRIG